MAGLVTSGTAQRLIAGSRFYMFDTEPLFGRMFEIAGGDLSALQWLTPEEAMRARP